MKTQLTAIALATVLFACGASDPAPQTAASTTPASETAAPTTASGSPIADAEKVVADLRPAFRACYNTGLAKDPKIAGKTLLVLKVDPTGAVTSAVTPDASTLPAEVVQCISDAAKQAKFKAPGGTGSTLNIPVTFKQNGT
jgi:outer membrane biosynthesis protein TonB